MQLLRRKNINDLISKITNVNRVGNYARAGRSDFDACILRYSVSAGIAIRSLVKISISHVSRHKSICNSTSN